MLDFLRRRRAARDEEPEGTTCQWCRKIIPATTNEELFMAGAVLDPLAGWFCSNPCAQNYGIRFRVQPSRTPPGGARKTR
ncbi:MAG TPA: hypothetical protein VFN91_06065 [Myxococcaceae bacterium]|nr:hypothetical protein [Myxococcaceae bacterium]